MNVRTLVLWGILGLLLFQPACQNPTEPDLTVTPLTTNVRGSVLRNDNLAPVPNAIVYDLGGLARDTSKSDGSFRLAYQLLSQTKTRIVATRAGFGNDTAAVTLNPGIDTTIALRVRADSTSPSGTTSSNGAANIVLISMSTDNISIRGTGANETTVLLFEVRDSLGVPIGGANKLKVDFKISAGPEGEEYVFPTSGETDVLTGRVGTRVTAGKKAGVLQVIASGTVPGTTKVIKSSPVKITISGGLPVAERFSLSRRPLNIAGGVYDNLRASVMAIIGDKEGNPVQPGTAVSFTTTGGIIQPNAVTDKDGIASVELISGNPRPQNSVAIVTAKTIGDSGAVIQKSIPVLFSGPTRILTPSTTVVVPDSGTASFEYRVQDPNGFPLVAGTSIALTVEGPGADELTLFGDVTKTLEDSNDPSSTLFKASVRDKKLKGANGNITFKISVTSSNGNSSTTFPGFVLADTSAAPPVFNSGQPGYAASLTVVNITNPQLSVSGTGETESTKLTFIAKDSVGTPVDIRRRAYVQFSISPIGGLGGGEFLFPAGDSTDASGMVSTTFSAGIRSGVVQVVARIISSGRSITSSPIRITMSGGLPDSNHFTATISPSSILSWPSSAGTTVGAVSVQVGDRYGNPVQPNTALYFSTNAGVIQPKALTDANGMASVDMFGGNPLPRADTAQITVQTVGEGGISITRKLMLVVTNAEGFADSTKITSTLSRLNMPGIAKSGAVGSVSVQMGDKFGNPVKIGTEISFSSTGGLIQPLAQTDANGQATAVIQGGNPLPNDPVLGPGFGRITLRTLGKNGAIISKTMPFLFSGAPRVILQNVPTDTVKIFDGSSFDVDYTVADLNGNPISAGNTISVSVAGQGSSGVALSGDINVNTPDTQDKANFTKYRFRVADIIANGGVSGELVFTITVTGESGTFIRRFYGALYSAQISTTVPPSARTPSQIAFLGITNSDIYVAGVGNTENTVITYEVRDSLGVPIDRARRVFATYTMSFFPNSGVGGGTPPTIVPASDSTDDSGKLRASMVSGTQAGVIQLVARVQLPGGAVVVSQPVKVTIHAGFPDRAHFTFRTSRYVFPGLDQIFIGPIVAPSFTVVVADTFSNPVQRNTAVYFHTQAGVIATGSSQVSGGLSTYTDDRGIATSNLITSNPLPLSLPFYDPVAGSGRPGYHWVYAQTQGRAGRLVIDSVLVVWSGAPIIITGVPTTTLPIPVGGGSTAPISISVGDRNGNPLPDGTTITATVITTNPPEGWSITTSLSRIIPNAGYARFPGPNITDFTFVVTNSSAPGVVSAGMTYLVEIVVSSQIETTKRYFNIQLQ